MLISRVISSDYLQSGVSKKVSLYTKFKYFNRKTYTNNDFFFFLFLLVNEKCVTLQPLIGILPFVLR